MCSCTVLYIPYCSATVLLFNMLCYCLSVRVLSLRVPGYRYTGTLIYLTRSIKKEVDDACCRQAHAVMSVSDFRDTFLLSTRTSHGPSLGASPPTASKDAPQLPFTRAAEAERPARAPLNPEWLHFFRKAKRRMERASNAAYDISSVRAYPRWWIETRIPLRLEAVVVSRRVFQVMTVAIISAGWNARMVHPTESRVEWIKSSAVQN